MSNHQYFDPRRGTPPYPYHAPLRPDRQDLHPAWRDGISYDDRNVFDKRPHYSHTPYHLQPDSRLPLPGTVSAGPISLITNGFETHLLLLLPPGSPLLATLLKVAEKKRMDTIETPPEDLIEHALDRKALQHISDGPTGGVWVLAKGKEEIISCLVLEFQGGWEVLGIGKGLSDGDTFLRHPCGFGPEVEIEPAKGKSKDKAEGGHQDTKTAAKKEVIVNSKSWIKAREKELKSIDKANYKAYLEHKNMNDPVSRVLLFGLKKIGLGGTGDGGGSSS